MRISDWSSDVLFRSTLGSLITSRWRRLLAISASSSCVVFPRAGISSTRGSEIVPASPTTRSEEHTSELQSLMRISYAVFCLKKKKPNKNQHSVDLTRRETPNIRLQYINNHHDISHEISQ